MYITGKIFCDFLLLHINYSLYYTFLIILIFRFHEKGIMMSAILKRAGSLNYLVLPTATASAANKTWIFKSKWQW